MSNFRLINRDIEFLMPPSVNDWLPERHLARFVVEIIEGLDLSAMRGSYRGSGEPSYPPQLLLGLIICGYATGVFSSPQAQAGIANFRRRFLPQIEELFVQSLHLRR